MSNITRPKQTYVDNAGYAGSAYQASNAYYASNADTLDNINSTRFVLNDVGNQKVTGSFSGNLNGTATNATTLNNLNSSRFARVDQANNYSGNQTITGYISASSGITGSFRGDGSGLTNLQGATITTSGNITGSGASGNSVTLKNSISITDITASNGYYSGSLTQGYLNNTYAQYSHAEGSNTKAYGYASHTEGSGSITYGTASHSEGYFTKTLSDYSHTEGMFCNSSDQISDEKEWEFGKIQVLFSTAGSFIDGIHSSSEGIYVAGNFPGRIALWNGTSLTNLASGLGYGHGQHVISGSDGIYASFLNDSGVGGLRKYNNGIWTNIALGNYFSAFSSSEGVFFDKYRYDGNTVTNLFSGHPIYKIISGSDGIYFGGEYNTLFRWNGNTSTQINLGTSYGNIESILSNSSGFFIGYNSNTVTKWDGNSNTVIIPSSVGNIKAAALFSSKNYLYVGNSKRYRYSDGLVQDLNLPYIQSCQNSFQNNQEIYISIANNLTKYIFDLVGRHAEGYMTTSSANYQHVQGTFNQTSSTALHIIGNGTADNARSNIFEVYTGSVNINGLLKTSPATKTTNSPGEAGQICWDSNYIYVCTATNTWKSSSLS